MIIKHTCLFFSQKKNMPPSCPRTKKSTKHLFFSQQPFRVEPTNLPRQYPPSNPYGPPPGGGQGIEFQIRVWKMFLQKGKVFVFLAHSQQHGWCGIYLPALWLDILDFCVQTLSLTTNNKRQFLEVSGGWLGGKLILNHHTWRIWLLGQSWKKFGLEFPPAIISRQVHGRFAGHN